MGQEIERARTLLAGLVREGILPADRANAAYEAWVGQPGDEFPFALFLVREGRAEPARVRSLLRLAAVQGMPHPERFTVERFEDLLMGQLGIEAGILSSKLLQTVRAVQDKKVEEGKLRRLDDLLPRAGYDPVQLRILREHLAERVLICPGCLSRFPRRDRLRVEYGCPRCGEKITSEALGESDLKLAPEQKQKQQELLASSNENSAVFETLTVAARERGARPAPTPKPGPSAGLVIVGVGSLVAVAAIATWGLTSKPKTPVRLQPRTTTTTTTTTDVAQDPADTTETAPPAGDQRPPTFTEARALDRRWAAEGRWAELAAMWRRVEPGPGEAPSDVRAFKAERVTELDRRVAHAAEASRLLESARSAGDDEALERALVLALDGAPTEAAPYGDIVRELRDRRARRRAGSREVARERLATARVSRAASGRDDPWAARLDQARRAALAAVEIGGRVADGVLVERLDDDGFALRMSDGDVRAFSWTADPALGLLVMQRAARVDAREDRLEVLRRALIARDVAAANMALSDLGAPKDAFDPAAVVATAATSAPPVAVAAGRWRLRWSTRAVGQDLTALQGALGLERGGLALAGEPCELATPTIEVAAGSDGPVELTLRVEADAREPFVAIDLLGQRGRRTYVVRWNAQGWRLEVDLGAGANVLKQGTLPAQAQAARLRVSQTELVVLLDGVERGTAPVASRHEAMVLRAGAAAGPVLITELTVEGALSSEWIARTTVDLTAEVDSRVDELVGRLAAQGPSELPRLSVEDPQGLARAPAATLEMLADARRALTSGDPERAANLLDEVEKQVPGLLAVLHLRALAAVLQGDLDAAHRRLTLALERDDTFSEARALLAFVHAQAGRREAALASAATAIEQRADLPHAHLAQARAAWQARLSDRLLSPELVTTPLAVARALAPGDPLVRVETRALQRGLKLEATLPTRLPEGPHAVMAAAGATQGAADLLKTINALSLRYERTFRRAGGPVSLIAALLPAQAPAGLLARDTAATWDPTLGLILVREGTSLGWDLAHAVARAFVARCYGNPPPWLESGLSTALAAPAAAEDPPGFKEVLGSAPAWDADAWRGLFAMELGPLRNNTLARAKAWALINYAQRQAPSWKVIAHLLDRLTKGEPVSWPADAPIDLGSLDAQLGTGTRRGR